MTARRLPQPLMVDIVTLIIDYPEVSSLGDFVTGKVDDDGTGC